MAIGFSVFVPAKHRSFMYSILSYPIYRCPRSSVPISACGGTPSLFFANFPSPLHHPALASVSKSCYVYGMEDIQMGRRVEFSGGEILEVRELLARGESYRTVARLMGMSLGMVQRIGRLINDTPRSGYAGPLPYSMEEDI